MQLLKPSWVNHDGDKAIFSVDIHPDGSRFATGGQGQDSSGRVVIWNLKPVVSEEAEEDPKVPKLLCQLDQHLGCVNCVRWSHSGRYLASAGDDKVIIIWQMSSYGGGAVFGSSIVNVESWRIVSTLRGHNGDILDVAWSPGDVWLASASIDNSVIVWNAAKWPEPIKVLRGHTGLVKGVIWDPVGRYLASQSDDKSLRIWRTSNWTTEQNIVEPFTECGGTTTVLRPSWSPDGQYLVSAHAMNNGGPTALIVERDGWNTDKDFVGHRKAITCVRFNPNILKKVDPKSSKPVQYCCVAIGSRDRSISIWFTSLKRPLVVVHDIFEDSVLDLSWSRCGRYLMSVSKDGSLAFIHFPSEEIGKPLSEEDTMTLHLKLYGNTGFSASSAVSTTIIENPELLKLQEQERSQSRCVSEKSFEESRAVPPPSAPTNKQIEMRTADGRRRITPMFIPPPAEGENSSKSLEASFSSSRAEKSKIIIEKVDGIIQPNVSSPTKSNSGKPLTEGKTSPVTSMPNHASAQPPPNELEGVPAGLSARIEVPGSTTGGGSDKPACMIAVKRKAEEALVAKKKRGRGRPPMYVYDKVDHAPAVPPPPAPASTQTKAATATTSFVVEKHILPVASMSKSTRVQIPGSIGVDGSSPMILIENDWRVSVRLTAAGGTGSLPALHRVSKSEAGGVSWAVYLPSQVEASATTNASVALACTDSSLHLLSVQNGSHILPPIQLHGRASQLFVHESSLIALTSDATLAIWDFSQKKRVMMESIRHLVEFKGGVKCVQMVGEGAPAFPVVVLKSGEAFSWCKDLGSWVQLGESSTMRRYVSSQYTLLPSCHPSTQHGKLSSILVQSATYCGSARFSFTNSLSSGVKQGLTEGFLKRMVTSAEYLDSPSDYKLWLKRLVKFFINESMERELREVFNDLLGPPHLTQEDSIKSCWNDKVMGFEKRDLLQEFLKEILIAENSLKLQRLHAEYQDQLKGPSIDSI